MVGTNKKTTPIEGELVTKEVAGVTTPRSISVGPAQLRRQMSRDVEIRKVIDEYISKNMVSGKDYGTIDIKDKNGNKHTSKPSLFKPGAEKFCGLFKIRPVFKKDTETWEMLGSARGIVAYICELVDSRGQVIGEGRGTATAKDGDYETNKAVKIAQKRAQIDAVLRTGALSDFFTQDLEDMPSGGSDTPASEKQREYVKSLLERRGVAIEEQAQYLIDNFGAPIPLTKQAASEIIEELQNG